METENENLKNGREILQHIKSIKDKYVAEVVDPVEEEMSFLDKLNKLVQLILKDDSISVYQVLNKESLREWKKRRLLRWFKKITINWTKTLYFTLLATITLFLVNEALSFYSIDGIITTKTYVKAILTEVCFVFLSGYRASGYLQVVWINSLRVGIFSLMLFAISSQTFMIGTKDISEVGSIQNQIEFIENQIKEKEKEIVYYRDVKNWAANTRERILEKEKLVEKLIILKDQQASGKNRQVAKIEEYKMYGRAFFRVMLLFISVLITRRMFVF